jgi:hypothetical protein
MNSRIAFLIFSITTLLANAAYADQPDCSNLVGNWENQLESTLSITSIDEKSGRLFGTYRSPSGTKGDAYELVGWINRSFKPGANTTPVVSFSVRWGDIGTITSWTGYCVSKGTPQLKTMWHLANPASSYEWDHIITNSDIFTPVTVK